VGRVASADVSPARPPVDVGEKPQQPTMARRETRMLGIDLADQLFFTGLLHPDLVRSRGEDGLDHIEHMFGCQGYRSNIRRAD
jgi:hypothetical protein